MIRDLKSYFQTVASRLSNAFWIEEFDTEHELEFWALAAEHVSREEPPAFNDIVQWIDLLYRAPVHFIYKKEKDELKLYRRQVLVENIKNKSEEDADLTPKQQQQIKKFEEHLENIEPRISWSEEYLNIGISSHGIGKCEHIPIFDGKTPWGIYCVGPYVKSPDSIAAKLPIVSRILSNWLVELEKKEHRPQYEYQAKVEKAVGKLGIGTLNIDRIADLFLGYIANLKSASCGGIIERTDQKWQYLAQYELTEEQIEWIQTNISIDDSIEQILNTLRQGTSIFDSGHIQVEELKASHTTAIIFICMQKEPEKEERIEKKISHTLNQLLTYRQQNLKISDELIDTYYQMLRQLEKAKERTYFHTPRMLSLVDNFGKLFGLEKDEHQQLLLTARLHDVGYIVISQLDERMTMGAELEHPFIGSMLIEALPLPPDVKEGIKTHHEWINGSGTPNGLKGEEIPWTGKIVGLFEFVVEFIESNRQDTSKSGEKWIETLSEELIERAENQFDMVLVPTAIELIRALGWESCITLGTDGAEN